MSSSSSSQPPSSIVSVALPAATATAAACSLYYLYASTRRAQQPTLPQHSNTSVSCNCGKVCIKLAIAKPHASVECCCCDCRRIRLWHLENSGSDDADDYYLLAMKKPATLFYVDNDILEVQGEGQLRLMKLRSGAGSLRMFSKCCHSVLLTIHPLYFRNRLCIVSDACNLEYEGDPVKPYCRMQTKFWNSKKLGELPPFEGDVTSRSDGPLWFVRTGLLQKMLTPACSSEGFSFHSLMKKLDLKDVDFANIDEPDLEGHFKTGGGVFSMTFRSPFR
jgi:hypothetical protein